MEVRRIGTDELGAAPFERPYLIAEAGVNHEGDLAKAKQMIREVASTGADAIKFQTYRASQLASRQSPSYWDTSKEPTSSQFELFSKYDSFWKSEFAELAEYAENLGIAFLSTPFDLEAVDILEPLVPAFKIASADITIEQLLEHVASKKKPILLSTGASTISEIHRALEVCSLAGNEEVVLLHCVLNYPTDLHHAHLGMIADMCRIFPDHRIGYSDHTLSEHCTDVLVYAWLLGASVVEKHYTFDKTLPGNDHYHAMDKTDLQNVCASFDRARSLLGDRSKHFLQSEEISRMQARRSLVSRRCIRAGESIRAEDIAMKRPGTGIPPSMLPHVVGGKALRDLDEDEILEFDSIQFSSKNPGTSR